MIGNIVKQINNLRITQDNKARTYRVYAPDGSEVYASPNAQEVARACHSCTQYLKQRAEPIQQLPPNSGVKQPTKADIKAKLRSCGNYNAEQLSELYKGVDKNVGIKWYIDPRYNAQQMRQIRIGLEKQLDVHYYANISFDWDQMDEIRKGLEERLPVNLYAYINFDSAQMEQIRLGLRDGVDISRYAIAGFDSMQIEEIRKGIASGVDIKKYAKLYYDSSQMEEVRLGLEKGIDISAYIEEECNGGASFRGSDDGYDCTSSSDIAAFALRMIVKNGVQR